ncbi:MAG TPA: redoxin domain-containing protein [Sedimentisphaerales bacterium]|nr:redoxin domain-containing protein [Sedimentisphaerales bacterium]
MKRYLILTVVAVMVLSLALPALGQREAGERRRPAEGRERRAGSQNLSPEERAGLRERLPQMSEEEREQFRNQMRERFVSGRPGMDSEGQRRMSERFEQQVAELRAKHEEAVGELKAIRELALKEKAKKTAARLDKLIQKHEEKLEKELAQVEQRRERFEKMWRDRPGPAGRERPKQPEAGRERVDRPEAGRPAPPFELNSFDGKTVRLSDYRGKTVVLEWFNFECPFVKHHYGLPKTMIKLANKYKTKNVVWLAINSTSHTTEQANIDFAKENKLAYPILDDRSGKVGHAYGAQTTPHMYIINPRGRIVYEGAMDNAPMGKAKDTVINYVDEALAGLTTGKEISTAKTKPYGCSVKYP